MDNCECINRLQSAFQVIECNTDRQTDLVESLAEVAMETAASAKFENKNKMAASRFAISNQSVMLSN